MTEELLKLPKDLIRRVAGKDPRFTSAQVTQMRRVLSKPIGAQGLKFDLPDRAPRMGVKAPRPGDYVQMYMKGVIQLTPQGRSTCKCKNLRDEMNDMGLEWCKRNIDSLTQKLEDNWQLIKNDTELSFKAVAANFVGVVGRRVAINQLLKKSFDDCENEYNAMLVKSAQREVRKQKRRRTQRPGNSPLIPTFPIEFTEEPTRTLMFHLYPANDYWERHIDYLARAKPLFDRLMMGVSTDDSTADIDEIKSVFGSDWEYFHVYDGSLREVDTYELMLPELGRSQNDVTYCAHGKGAQKHTSQSEAINWWTNAMYETVILNHDEVEEALYRNHIVGSFRRTGSFLGTKFRWHFSGSFYAFRNCITFNNGVPGYRQNWWGTESWPGDHFKLKDSHCIIGHGVNDMYKARNQPRKEFDQWLSK